MFLTPDQEGGITIAVPAKSFKAGVRDLVAKLKTFRYEGERRLRLIADYANSEECRSVFIRRYFGEEYPPPERLLQDRDIKAGDAVIVGLSVGTYPATYLANRVGARLFSVASADRGDLAIWQSPATRIIKNRAVKRGLSLKHYSRALSGSHPAENLTGIAPNSVFVIGKSDPYVPPDRKRGLLRAIETHVQDANVIELDAGHFKTLMVSGRYQRRLLGKEFARRTWRLPVPFWRAASDSHTPEVPSLNAT